MAARIFSLYLRDQTDKVLQRLKLKFNSKADAINTIICDCEIIYRIMNSLEVKNFATKNQLTVNQAIIILVKKGLQHDKSK